MNQVQKGVMSLDELMESTTPCSVESCAGSCGGSGGKSVYGFTGTSPPTNTNNATPALYRNIHWLFALLITAMLFTLGACNKQAKCPDGYDYSIQNSPPTMTQSAAAEDWCEAERTAVAAGVQDSIQSAQNVRDAIWPALNDPMAINSYYWSKFKYFPRPRDDFLDSVNSHISTTAQIFEDMPGHPNELNLRILQELCYVYRDDVVPGMVIKRDALTDCEKNVGIDEFEWVNDPCGGYWTSTRTKR